MQDLLSPRGPGLRQAGFGWTAKAIMLRTTGRRMGTRGCWIPEPASACLCDRLWMQLGVQSRSCTYNLLLLFLVLGVRFKIPREGPVGNLQDLLADCERKDCEDGDARQLRLATCGSCAHLAVARSLACSTCAKIRSFSDQAVRILRDRTSFSHPVIGGCL